jgi:hypothetical protein
VQTPASTTARRYLLRHGHDPYILDKYGTIPLQLAASVGNREMVVTLLEPFDNPTNRREQARRVEYLNQQDTQVGRPLSGCRASGKLYASVSRPARAAHEHFVCSLYKCGSVVVHARGHGAKSWGLGRASSAVRASSAGQRSLVSSAAAQLC